MVYLTQHYKNLSEQLQAKVNHLKQLMEAEVKTKDPPPVNRENSRSRGRTRPPSTTLRDESGFKSEPDVKLPDPLQSDPATSNNFAKMAQSTSPLATSIKNIPNLPGDIVNDLYNKSPWMTVGGIGVGAVYTGIPRTWKNPVTNTLISYATKIFPNYQNPNSKNPATSGKGGYNVQTPQPSTFLPTPAKPSSLAGKFDFPEFSNIFDPNPTRTTGGVLKSFGSDVVAALKPGGIYSAIERWKARSQNDEIVKKWTEVTKPRGESNIRASNVLLAKPDLANANRILNTRTSELNTLRQIHSPNSIKVDLTDLTTAKEAEVAGATEVRNKQLSNLKSLKTTAKAANIAAETSSAAYIAATQEGVPLSRFDFSTWAKDRLNPKSIAGLRNLATGGVGLVGDLVVGQAVRSGLDEVPYLKDQDILKDVASATAGGAAGGAIVSGLSGVALGAAAIPAALIAGTGALSYGVGEKIAKITGLEDKLSGMSAIRKTPGITRAELDRMHPPYKEEPVGAKK